MGRVREDGMRKSKKVYAICHHPDCDNEFSFVPSGKKKYCSSVCYQEDPEMKKRRRTVHKHFFVKEYVRKEES